MSSAAITGILTATAKNSEIFEVMPLFGLAIFLYLLPLFWPEKPDPFSPLCHEGIFGASGLLASMFAFMSRGNLLIRILPHLSSATRLEIVQQVLVAMCLGTVAHYWGYYMNVGSRVTWCFPRFQPGPWNGRRLLVVTVVCLAFFIPAYVYFHGKVGTGIFDLTELHAGKMVWRNDPTSSWLARSVLLGFMPIMFAFAVIMVKPRISRVLTISIIALVYFVLITRLGQRGYFALCGLTLIVIAHYMYRRIRLSVFVVLLFFALFAANVLGQFRGQKGKMQASDAFRQDWSVGRVLNDYGEDRGRLDGLAYGFYAFPTRRDYLMGESYAALLVIPIPRWLWPEKADHFVNRDTGIVFQGVGAPIPMPFLGVLYTNFSWVGIVVGMMFWGIFRRALYEWLLESNFDKSTIVLYTCILIFFNPTLLAIAVAIQFAIPAHFILRFIEQPSLVSRLQRGPTA